MQALAPHPAPAALATLLTVLPLSCRLSSAAAWRRQTACAAWCCAAPANGRARSTMQWDQCCPSTSLPCSAPMKLSKLGRQLGLTLGGRRPRRRPRRRQHSPLRRPLRQPSPRRSRARQQPRPRPLGATPQRTQCQTCQRWGMAHTTVGCLSLLLDASCCTVVCGMACLRWLGGLRVRRLCLSSRALGRSRALHQM